MKRSETAGIPVRNARSTGSVWPGLVTEAPAGSRVFTSGCPEAE